MLSRMLASVVVLGATLCLMTIGVNAANAAPSTAPGSVPQAAVADTSLMADCFVYNGDRRGCTYYNPENAFFRVCDYPDPGGTRYTDGRISVNGSVQGEFIVTTGTSESYCSYAQYIPVGRGDRVCIHTGVQGLGWTAPECRTF